MTTYVLVPGMCHGAWCFDDLADSLRDAGHHVLAVTLTGVAERSHLIPGGVNLDTHITDVLAEIHARTGAADKLIIAIGSGHEQVRRRAVNVADKAKGRPVWTKGEGFDAGRLADIGAL